MMMSKPPVVQLMSRSRTEQSTPMLSVYDGRQCVGFELTHGCRGYEAFEPASDRSVCSRQRMRPSTS
jgi:hypothetical protein